MQIFLQLVVLEQFHHSLTVYFYLLVERNKREIFRILGNVAKRTSNCIQIMSSNRGILSGSTESIVELFLSSDECLVCLLVKSNVTEDGSCNKWANLLNTRINGDGGRGCSQHNFRYFRLTEVKFECADQAGLRKQIRAVVHAVELEVFLNDLAILIALLVFFDLYSKLETKVIKPLKFQLLSHQLEESLALDLEVRH